jgi:hypothetical protein
MEAECSLLVKNRLKTDKVQEPFSQPSANAHGTPGCCSPGTLRAKTLAVRRADGGPSWSATNNHQPQPQPYERDSHFVSGTP